MEHIEILNKYYREVWEKEFPNSSPPLEVTGFIEQFSCIAYSTLLNWAELRSAYITRYGVQIGIGDILIDSLLVMQDYIDILAKLKEDLEDANIPEGHKECVDDILKCFRTEDYKTTQLLKRRRKQLYKMRPFVKETFELRIQYAIVLSPLIDRVMTFSN